MSKPRITLGALVDRSLARASKRGVELMIGPVNPGDRDVEVQGIIDDSRDVEHGVLYCAVVGERHDGHDYVGDAVAKGAAAVLVDHPVPEKVPQIVVGGVRPVMPWLASAYWADPSDHLPTIGVTGTNGKTTITSILGHIAEVAGGEATVIGTLSGLRTTPEAPELQSRLAQGVREGHVLAALEVSSHALDQHRADAVNFSVGVFTNLTIDHLDYHSTMEEYFVAKAKLFDGRALHHVIVVDDEWGERLAEEVSEAVIVRRDELAIESPRGNGSTFLWRDRRVTFPLVGDFNVVNAVCAAEAARAIGVDDDTIVRALGTMTRVPGRMDPVPDLPAGLPTVYVDYSHTPDGLARALRALRPRTEGRLICVFGAGGDRDVTKRPLMGTAAEQSSDITIVTSDNPRSEDPNVIIDQVLSGMSAPNAAWVEPERDKAIARALAEATVDDIVLVAGKGHENTQTIKGEKLPFDDRLVVQEAAAALAATRKDS